MRAVTDAYAESAQKWSAVTRVFGPPGTGKTTHLIGRVERLLEGKYQPDRIGYISFTRAAVDEARRRMMERFGLGRDELPWFRTIHSIAYRLLGIQKEQIVARRFKEFCKAHPDYGLTEGGPVDPEDWVPVEPDPNGRLGDFLLQFWDWTRNCRYDVRTALSRFDGVEADQLDAVVIERFVEIYEGWKHAEGLLDFSDLLIRAYEDGYHLPVDCLVVDECQDLSPLQWALVDEWKKERDFVYLAGDDDQAIYSFQGAKAALFLNQPGTMRVLSQSYRVPAKIHALAESVIRQVTQRAPKTYQPRTDAGQIIGVSSLDDVPFGDGSWFVLVRNRYLLAGVQRSLEARGLLYRNLRGSDPLGRKSHVLAVEAAYLLSTGQQIDLDQWRRMLDVMTSEPSILRRGCKEQVKRLLAQSRNTLVDLLTLSEYGAMPNLLKNLGGSEPLEVLDRIPAESRSYYRTVIREHGIEELKKPPRITIGTIHSVKGQEAEHVVLLTDMAKRTWEGFERNPDDEHRVWYVGITRARESLYLVERQGRYGYTL